MATYNRGTTSKPAQTTSAAPAKSEQSRKPVGSLHIQANGAEQKEKLTGLFKEVAKNGQTYYRGKDKDGNKFIVFLD